METSNELLLMIYKLSDMGIFTMTELLKGLKNKDNKIKKLCEDILKSYECFLKDSKESLNKQEIKLEGNSVLAKIGARMGIMNEVKSDNSDSSIAELLIQGLSMGTIEMERLISQYKDIVTKKDLKLAKEFLKFQQKMVSELKSYL